jgi:hypothetical protein
MRLMSDLVKNPLSLSGDKYSSVVLGEQVRHASGVEAGVTVASHKFSNSDWVDSSSLSLLPEGPDGRPDAGESFFEILEREQSLQIRYLIQSHLTH